MPDLDVRLPAQAPMRDRRLEIRRDLCRVHSQVGPSAIRQHAVSPSSSLCDAREQSAADHSEAAANPTAPRALLVSRLFANERAAIHQPLPPDPSPLPTT
jgi:hypothetical protein